MQSIALIFIVIGIRRIYNAYKAEYYENINDGEFPTSEVIRDMLINQELIGFSFFIFSTLIISYVNYKNKVSIINTIIVFLIVLLLFLLGFFDNGILHGVINSYCYFFTDDIGFMFLIGGVMLIAAGVVILWKTNKVIKKELITKTHII